MADITKIGFTTLTTPWMPNFDESRFNTPTMPEVDLVPPEIECIDTISVSRVNVLGLTATAGGYLVISLGSNVVWAGTVTNSAPRFQIGTPDPGPGVNNLTVPISTLEVLLRSLHNGGRS